VALRESPAARKPESEPAGHAASKTRETSELPARIVCAACGGFVTSASTRLSKEGRHQHRFMNPDGLTFEIACFASAPGAVGAGEQSSVWTWFPGYVWQALVCSGCVRHLGWVYSSASDRFVGLISDRILELPAQS